MTGKKNEPRLKIQYILKIEKNLKYKNKIKPKPSCNFFFPWKSYIFFFLEAYFRRFTLLFWTTFQNSTHLGSKELSGCTSLSLSLLFSLLSCVHLCDPVDYSPPGSSAYGMSQARILEWVAISFSRERLSFLEQFRLTTNWECGKEISHLLLSLHMHTSSIISIIHQNGPFLFFYQQWNYIDTSWPSKVHRIYYGLLINTYIHHYKSMHNIFSALRILVLCLFISYFNSPPISFMSP